LIKLEKILHIESWDEVLKETSPSKAYQVFISILCTKITQCTEILYFNPSSSKMKPWLNYSLLNMIKKKNKLACILTKHPNNLKLRSKVHELAKITKIECNKLKKQYYQKKFMACQNDQKKQWQLVNTILGSSNQKLKIQNIIDCYGSIVSDDDTMAKEFNIYFSSVGSKLKSTITQGSTVIEHANFNYPNFFFFPIVENECNQIIMSLKNNSSLGSDGISTFIVKKISHLITIPLCHIINLSFLTGEVPDALKQSVVIPLLKKGDPILPSNYRLISFLRVFSKILEKCVKSRILSFLKKNKFLSRH